VVWARAVPCYVLRTLVLTVSGASAENLKVCEYSVRSPCSLVKVALHVSVWLPRSLMSWGWGEGGEGGGGGAGGGRWLC
jgi:hypothetical protein